MSISNKKNIKLSSIIVTFISLLTLILIFVVFNWLSTSYSPSQSALKLLSSTSLVEVSTSEDWTTFTPTSTNDTTKGIIFYPGAKVEAAAYSSIAQNLASNGYLVSLAHMPINFPLLGTNIANDIIDSYPTIDSWIMIGHSLGGVAASNFAATSDAIDGIVLLASYPTDDSLKTKGIPTLSIWGSNDGVLNFDSLKESKDLLPTDTIFLPIEGGNHAQFGDYGIQEDDNSATISGSEQQLTTVNAILDWLP